MQIKTNDKVRVIKHEDQKLIGEIGLVTAVTKTSAAVCNLGSNKLSCRQIPLEWIEKVDKKEKTE